MIGSEYWFSAILIPFLVFARAALGLNILTGYAGQLSLGTAAFMAVGAFASYNFMLRVPGMPILLAFVGGGTIAALVGILFGLPSLRIRGFYLAVATLAAQFFILWFLTKVGWVTITAPGRDYRPTDRRFLATVCPGKMFAGAVDRDIDGACVKNMAG
jgi:branched-chain amino acid transport system permease protein